MVYVSAKAGPSNHDDPQTKFTVQYVDEDGNIFVRSGGSRAWRCNNPGNLLASTYSRGKDRHSIGSAGDGVDEYAVYPDYETGHEALVVMLGGSVYSPLTLRAAMKRFDKRNPRYIDSIVTITHLDPERTIKSLSKNEFEKFWKAIEQIEEWTVGNEEPFEVWSISGVHKKRGVITEYLLRSGNDLHWVNKQEAIKLANDGRLSVVIVHLKCGNEYLRPTFGSGSFELIV
jgi:hypothetical protein